MYRTVDNRVLALRLAGRGVCGEVGSGRFGQRHGHRECAAFSRGGLGVEAAAIRVVSRWDRASPSPVPSMSVACSEPVEGAEQSGHVFGLDAHAGVGDGHAEVRLAGDAVTLMTIRPSRRLYLMALESRFSSTCLSRRRSARTKQLAVVGSGFDVDLDTAGGREWAHQADRFADHSATCTASGVEFDSVGFDAGDVQHVVDHGEQVFAAAQDMADGLVL